jgi:hypothetical protein
MDPNADKTPGLGLPQPSIEQGGPVFDPSTHTMQHHKELEPISAEMQPVAMPPALPIAPVDPAAAPTPSLIAQAMAATADQPVAAIAATTDDSNSDDLDEEWVNKAKAIVEQTKTDPFLESRELGKVKADYLKIRYNKQIKVAEEQP